MKTAALHPAPPTPQTLMEIFFFSAAGSVVSTGALSVMAMGVVMVRF